MTIPFSTHINGKPTLFPEKILKSLEHVEMRKSDRKWMYDLMASGLFDLDKQEHVLPKIHTLREDKHNRLLPGVIIDGFINSRTVNMLRIMPKVPIVSTQEVLITFKKETCEFFEKWPTIIVDNHVLSSKNVEQLAINDGFEDEESFFEYFKNGFQGKIVHWTNHRY